MVKTVKKVFVALSGGVDSSTAAALLRQSGFDCAGVFMVTNDRSADAQSKAGRTAEKLGMKLYVLDLRKDFEQILDYFCGEYRRGRTPNPCVLCNRRIKFGKLWDFAQANGAELLATGHYARILKDNNTTGLYAAADTAKDQSYALSMIDRNILGHILVPMGGYSKNETREMAAKLGLAVEQEPESQEICFIPNNDYIAAVEKRCPQLVRKGDIVDSSGSRLGKHDGIHRFTIGQRRGLRLAMGSRCYVVKIDAESNTVTLGPKEEVMHRKLLATSVNWLIDKPESCFRAKVKIRYNDNGTFAMVSPQDDVAVVEFDQPVSAITPGQLAAFYVRQENGDRVVGGGWIEKADN
jgi:tRNA-specific 2-thiouridylase